MLELGAISGILSSLIAFTCILAAIATYPSFSWTQNALSDLGIIPGITSAIFNFGLLASGLLALIFAAFGLYIYNSKLILGKIGSVVFGAGAVALFCIGTFNENYSPIHYLVSLAFFTLIPIGLFIMTSGFVLARRSKFAVFTVLIGLAAVTPWVFWESTHYFPNVAIPEVISGLCISAWTITLSYQMLKENSI